MDDITLKASAMIGGAVGFAASLLGLVQWQRRIAVQDAAREMAQQRVMERLDEMMVVERKLAEVLSHPGDTSFSVAPVLQNQREIIETLKRIEENLQPRSSQHRST